MGSETFSEFLLPLKFKLDEPSKKKFDAAILETEKRFKEIGVAATAAAAALYYAIREISKNLSSLAYSAERVGASSEELKALGNAAERVGVGAEAATSSLNAFFAFVNFEGGASAIKQWFNIDFDPKHPLKAMLDSAVKLADTYATGTVAQRQTAIVEARRAGINEKLLTTPGAARRLRDEIAKDEAFTGGKLNPIAEKAKRLNAEFEKVKQHLEDISELTSGSLMDAFSHLLEKADGWLKAHRDDIIWFSNQAAELAKNIMEVTKGEVRLLARLEANTSELMRIQDIIGKIREALKWLGEGDIASKINTALEWAFLPFKWLWDKLQSLGLVGPSVGPGAAAGGGFGPGEGMESGGHGTERRGRFGHGGGVDKNIPGVPYTAGEATSALSTNQAHYDTFRNTVAQIESGGKYNIMGGAGGHFAGRYQLGAIGHPELADTAKSLGVPTPKIAEFLANPKMQEQFFERYTLNHHKWLMANSPEYHALNADDKLAALGYAHNQGAGGLAQYLRTHKAGRDAFGTGGDVYERAIRKSLGELKKVPSAGQSVIPGQADPHKPGFDPSSVPFHHSGLFPLGHQHFANNEHHDNRVLNSNVEVKVSGGSPIEKTSHPLERTKNATLIRNTTATAS